MIVILSANAQFYGYFPAVSEQAPLYVTLLWPDECTLFFTDYAFSEATDKWESRRLLQHLTNDSEELGPHPRNCTPPGKKLHSASARHSETALVLFYVLLNLCK